MTFGTGAAAAILAFIIGLAYTRPSMAKAMALSQRMASADATERQALASSIETYRSRAELGGKLVITLLLIAATAMAIGRYVP
jgi:hypothetical protein